MGRLEVIKGVEPLAKLFSQVEGADLLVAGSGSRAGWLQELAADNPRIRLLGEVPAAELGRYYDHCVACVVPSLTYEVFPTVVLEAFSRRAPVVARDRGGLTEMIEESGGGILFRRDEELVAAMNHLVLDREQREELGERGYRAFEQSWTRERHLERYLELLAELAERKLGRVPWLEEQVREGARVRRATGR